MPRSRLVLALTLAAVAVGAAPVHAADVPSPGALYETGPSGRYLIDGSWRFRLLGGAWRTVQVPYAWNVTDPSAKGFRGGIGEYVKDFRLPSSSAAYDWVVRFESVNYRTRVSLNGHTIGTNEGAYLPFEVELPARLLKRGATNRLSVRVDSRRNADDLPPMGVGLTSGQPTGGWWNYGGILREVYLRRVRHADIGPVQVLPDVPCATCTATVRIRATVRNADPRAQAVHLTGTFGGQAFDAGNLTLGPSATRTFTARIAVARPELWSPHSPHLYPVRLVARAGGAVVQTWQTEAGIRSVKVVGGRLYLNGGPVNWRGFGLHEDSLTKGFALDNADRKQIIDWVQDLGATLIRSHYPLHPELMELADRAGIMVWSEIPVYQVRPTALKHASVRNKGVDMLRRNILANGTHPSVVVWSIANELNSKVNANQAAYIRKAAGVAHALDSTRPIGQAVASNVTVGCQKGFAPLDIIGFNEYFNWYPGPDGTMADRDNLPIYLKRMRRCYPAKAIAVTEVGAEANREGPVEERGTYAFQSAFAQWHFDELAKLPWLSGATWWALQEFRVRPNWDGGNPRPNPPFHQKGLITMTGAKKPAYGVVQQIFRATDQFPGR